MGKDLLNDIADRVVRLEHLLEPKHDDTLGELAAQMDEAQERDAWRHRSSGMRCASCMWYADKANGVGRCRRHAPTMNGYPVVFLHDWCGDHKLSETEPASRPRLIPPGDDE